LLSPIQHGWQLPLTLSTRPPRTRRSLIRAGQHKVVGAELLKLAKPPPGGDLPAGGGSSGTSWAIGLPWRASRTD